MSAAIKGAPLEFYDKQRFIVEADGIEYGGFATCSEIGGTLETIKHREGGRKTQYKKTGNVEYPPATLTRGLSSNREIYEWWRAVKNGTLKGDAARKTIRIIQRDEGEEDKVLFVCYRCIPVDDKFGPWDNSAAEVALESFSFEYEDYERIDLA